MEQSPFNSIISWKANLQHINLSGITSLTNHDKHQVRESRDLVRSGGSVSFWVKDEEQSHSSGLFFPSQLSSRNLSTELKEHSRAVKGRLVGETIRWSLTGTQEGEWRGHPAEQCNDGRRVGARA